MLSRRLSLIVVAGGLSLAACGDGITLGSDVVARAESHELRVQEVAQWLVEGRTVPLRHDILDRFVQRWVEYSLYAQHLAKGDSLTDSLTILRAMWPDIEQAKLDAMHERMVEERVKLDSAVVDSAYRAGERRVLYHILIRATQNAPAAERARARRRAQSVREQAVAGTPWSDLNERYNEDPGARQTGGNLGMLSREDLAPEFADVGFDLAPSAISEVTETGFGYHVIWRPSLDSVYDSFRDKVQGQLVARMDSLYYDELERDWRVTVRGEAPARAREAGEAPMESMYNRDVLGTFRGGKFTVGDFVRWLQVLSPVVHQEVFTSSDEDLTLFLKSLMRNEVMIREAAEARIPLPEEAYQRARENYLTDLRRLRSTIGLDSAMAAGTTVEERSEFARQAVSRYLARMMRTLRDVVIVPPFLANELRRTEEWAISRTAMDRVLGIAAELRSPRDTASSGGGDE